ncbi:alpha/beta hydrolase [Marininema halotolerans]|uniref:Lysophospholipase, alpha-beta hydrolase superfamily n=1 Tax=Marininema halotolerans TaxID=1155944 RepID=A0A1I6PR40_9BACL|nr:alpha/beta hydrolase [Marininema halotolerans]SFS42505.1 Lysophospholipase, alpha-beta hydrolase superfamily [Marininema halotolerans]
MRIEIIKHLPKNDSFLPPLLFVHGASHGAWCWEENFLPFFAAQGFPAYALSFRGHGESEGRDQLNEFSVDDYIEDVLQVLEELNEPPILIGHSLGGAVVQKVMQTKGDLLRAVVLMASSPPIGMMKEWAKIVLTRFRSVYQMNLFNKGKTQEFPMDLLFPPDLPEEMKKRYAKLLQPESYKAAEDMIRLNIEEDSIRRDIPIMVMGSKDDRFFSYKIALKVAKYYHVDPIILSGVCHDMMLDPHWKSVAEPMLSFFHENVPSYV